MRRSFALPYAAGVGLSLSYLVFWRLRVVETPALRHSESDARVKRICAHPSFASERTYYPPLLFWHWTGQLALTVLRGKLRTLYASAPSYGELGEFSFAGPTGGAHPIATHAPHHPTPLPSPPAPTEVITLDDGGEVGLLWPSSAAVDALPPDAPIICLFHTITFKVKQPSSIISQPADPNRQPANPPTNPPTVVDGAQPRGGGVRRGAAARLQARAVPTPRPPRTGTAHHHAQDRHRGPRRRRSAAGAACDGAAPCRASRRRPRLLGRHGRFGPADRRGCRLVALHRDCHELPWYVLPRTCLTPRYGAALHVPPPSPHRYRPHDVHTRLFDRPGRRLRPALAGV